MSGKRNIKISRSHLSKIAARFKRELIVTLYEMYEGSRRYKQLDNIAGQIFREYHDRALVELIQNAHDPSNNTPIKIILDEVDYEKPCLFVANKGIPFTDKNFLAITEISLSDKQDLDELIGNKGVGFRSVLQICNNPIIYSREAEPSKRDIEPIFEGYCFYFSPESHKIVIEAVEEELRKNTPGPNVVLSEVFDEEIWLITSLEKYIIEGLKKKLEKSEIEIEEELSSLSPYALPLPQDQNKTGAILSKLAGQGFVTVIELQLHDDTALMDTKSMIKKINKDCLLFTPKVNELIIEHVSIEEDADLSATMLYEPKKKGETNEYRTVTFLGDTPKMPEEESDVPHEWRILSDEIAHEDLKPFLSELPKSWHKMERATISVAVPLSKKRRVDGVISIFLPTEQKTSSAVSINAPFYGDMARTEVNFKNKYNDFLLKRCADLVIKLFRKLVDDEDLRRKVAAIDLIMSFGFEPLGIILENIIKENHKDFDELKFIPLVLENPEATRDFASIKSVRTFPEKVISLLNKFKIITPEAFVRIGKKIFDYKYFSDRTEDIKRLCEWRGVDIEIDDETFSNWIEKLASSLEKSRQNITLWREFYEEFVRLDLAKQFIIGKNVLLTHDYRLLSNSDEDITIFAPPVLTISDEEDEDKYTITEDSSDNRLNPPSILKDRIAYFNPLIELRDEKNKRSLNMIGQYLRDRNWLLKGYRPRTIIQQVIIPSLEKMDYNKEVNSCREILLYAYGLVIGMRSREDLERLDVSELPIPCKGGWFPAKETYFSEGWSPEGKLLERCFRDIDRICKRLLLEPNAFLKALDVPYDNASIDKWKEFLGDVCKIKAFPRLILEEYSKGDSSRLRVGGSFGSYDLKKLDNIFHVPENVWVRFIEGLNALSPPIQTYAEYYLKRIESIEGFFEISSDSFEYFAQLVCIGFQREYCNFLNVGFYREDPGYKPYGEAHSLLYHILRESQWLPSISFEPYDNNPKPVRPDLVWHIPVEDMQFRNRSFVTSKFIPHISPKVATYFNDDIGKTLGVGRIPPTSQKDAMEILKHLIAIWAYVRSEHYNHFISLWRETIDLAMDFWNEDSHPPINEKLAGLLIQPPGQKSEIILSFEKILSEEKLLHIWFPDDESREKMIGSSVNLVKIEKRKKKDLYRGFLEEIVPEHVKIHDLSSTGVTLSDKDGNFIPYELTESFWNQLPKLARFILAIYGIGRKDKMDLEGREFQGFVKRLKALHYIVLQDFSVRFHLVDAELQNNPNCFLWSLKEGDILVVDEIKIEGWEELSGSIELLAGVQDLEPYLAAGLSKMEYLGIIQDITGEDLERALNNRGIKKSEFEKVGRASASGGDIFLEQAILSLSCLSGQPEHIKEYFMEAIDFQKTEMALIKDAVDKYCHDEFDEQLLHNTIQNSFTDDDLGYALWRNFGISLSQFNQVRTELGLDKCPKGNEFLKQKEDNFSYYRDIILKAIKPLLRKVARTSGMEEKYLEWCDNWKNLNFAEVFTDHEYWELEPSHMLSCLKEWWVSLELNQESEFEIWLNEIAGYIWDDSSCRKKTKEMGLDYDFPEEENRENGIKLIERYSQDLRLKLLAYMLGNNLKHLLGTVVDILSQNRFSDGKSKMAILSLASLGVLDIEMIEKFWVLHLADIKIWSIIDLQIDGKNSLPREIKNIDAHIIDKAKSEEKKWNENRLSKSKDIKIFGNQIFLPSDDPIFDQDTIDVIEERMVSLLSEIDLDPDKKSKLEKPKEYGTRKGAINKKMQKTKGRMSQWEKTTIGAIGEFFFFKSLKRKYGQNIGLDSWVSENKERFFPLENGNDSAGYDFEFEHRGKRTQVEIKSSVGLKQIFDLGSTQISAANKARTQKRTTYTICYISNVLENPEFHFLGNPFLPSNRKNFIFDEGSLKVRFRLKAA
jgi:hypothetical protein